MMSGSFFALLDDIAVLARAAAASVDDVVAGVSRASAKVTGVVIDDAAVTPQYVRGISPKRELPVVWRITRGSLLNKAGIIVVIMALSFWAPEVFPWLLILGGSYLAFEGAEKIIHWLRSRHRPDPAPEEVAERSGADEQRIVRSALRTDVVLSAEIMLISLATIDAGGPLMRTIILIAVGAIMTLGVYGTVGVLIKLDDVGLWLVRRPSGAAKSFGAGLVRAMPIVFSGLTIVGVAAMLWIGGQILIENLAEVGWPLPHELLAALTEAIGGPAAVAWGVGSTISAAVGLVWGALLVGAGAGAAYLRPDQQ